MPLRLSEVVNGSRGCGGCSGDVSGSILGGDEGVGAEVEDGGSSVAA